MPRPFPWPLRSPIISKRFGDSSNFHEAEVCKERPAAVRCARIDDGLEGEELGRLVLARDDDSQRHGEFAAGGALGFGAGGRIRELRPVAHHEGWLVCGGGDAELVGLVNRLGIESHSGTIG